MKRLLLTVLFAAALAVAQEQTAEHGATTATHQAGHEEQSEEGGLEIWKWANFLILAGALGYLMAKNLPAFFAGRTAEIQSGIAEASRLKADAEARAAATEAKVAALGADIEALRAGAKTALAKEAERMRQETAAQMARLEAHGEQEITALASHARKDLKVYAAGLAVDLAGRRIQERMDPASQDALVSGFLRKVASSAEKRS